MVWHCPEHSYLGRYVTISGLRTGVFNTLHPPPCRCYDFCFLCSVVCCCLFISLHPHSHACQENFYVIVILYILPTLCHTRATSTGMACWYLKLA